MGTFSIRTQTFRLGLADYRALWLAELRRPSRMLLILFIVFELACGIPFLVGGDDLLNGRCMSYLLTLFACLGLSIGAVVLVFTLSWQQHRQNPVMTGDRIMILDTNAIRLIGHGLDTRHAWSAVSGVDRGRRHLFFYMPGQPTLVVPKRALASPDEADRLVTAARTAIRAARKNPAALPPPGDALDNRDLWRGAAYRMVLQRPLKYMLLRLLTVAILLPTFTMLGLVIVSGGQVLALPDRLIIFPALIAMFAIIFLVMLPLLWLALRRLPHLQGEREVCFTRDYVRSTGRYVDVRLDWSNVRGVSHTQGVFIFQVATGWFHIPASAFATKTQAMAFYSQAVAFWRAAEARRELHP